MSYSLKLTECPGDTIPHIYVCEVACLSVDMDENIRHASYLYPSIIILVEHTHYGMLEWHLKEYKHKPNQASIQIMACGYEVIEIAKRGGIVQVLIDPNRNSFEQIKTKFNEFIQALKDHEMEQYEKNNVRDYLPDKSEIRERKQQDRYRQNHHARFHKK